MKNNRSHTRKAAKRVVIASVAAALVVAVALIAAGQSSGPDQSTSATPDRSISQETTTTSTDQTVPISDGSSDVANTTADSNSVDDQPPGENGQAAPESPGQQLPTPQEPDSNYRPIFTPTTTTRPEIVVIQPPPAFRVPTIVGLADVRCLPRPGFGTIIEVDFLLQVHERTLTPNRGFLGAGVHEYTMVAEYVIAMPFQEPVDIRFASQQMSRGLGEPTVVLEFGSVAHQC